MNAWHTVTQIKSHGQIAIFQRNIEINLLCALGQHPVFRHVGCFCVKFAGLRHFQTAWASNTQHVAKRRNRVVRRAQQYCDMLRWNITIIWPGLKISSISLKKCSTSVVQTFRFVGRASIHPSLRTGSRRGPKMKFGERETGKRAKWSWRAISPLF